MVDTIMNWQVWTRVLGTAFFGIVLGLVLHYILFKVFGRMAKRSQTTFDDSLVKHSRNPARALFLLLAISFFTPLLTVSAGILDSIRHVLSLCFIAATAWLFVCSALVGCARARVFV